MPTRQRIHKYPSKEIQGEDSWVTCSLLTVRDQRMAKQAITAGKDPAEVGVEIILEHVLEWNWVDDDGNPMPQLKDDPEYIENMTDAEITFLTECISGTTNPKN